MSNRTMTAATIDDPDALAFMQRKANDMAAQGEPCSMADCPNVMTGTIAVFSENDVLGIVPICRDCVVVGTYVEASGEYYGWA